MPFDTYKYFIVLLTYIFQRTYTYTYSTAADFETYDCTKNFSIKNCLLHLIVNGIDC